jgi:hypothetical protein
VTPLVPHIDLIIQHHQRDHDPLFNGSDCSPNSTQHYHPQTVSAPSIQNSQIKYMQDIACQASPGSHSDRSIEYRISVPRHRFIFCAPERHSSWELCDRVESFPNIQQEFIWLDAIMDPQNWPSGSDFWSDSSDFPTM